MVSRVAPGSSPPARLGPSTAPPSSRPPAPPPADVADLNAPTPTPVVEEDRVRLTPWQKVGLAGLGALSLLGAVVAVGIKKPRPDEKLQMASRSTSASLEREVSLDQWRDLLKPPQDVPVKLPSRPGMADRVYAPRTVAETRQRLAELKYPDLDPFVASVASDMWASIQGGVKDQVEWLKVPGRFEYSVRVGLGLQNGPDAPMLVILPGVHGESGDAKIHALKRMALESGMNYLVLDNAFGSGWLYGRPAADPGNLQWEAETTLAILQQVRAKYPQHMRKVSVVGYSYGASLGASLLSHQEKARAAHPNQPALINGSFVSLSPAQDMTDSLRLLDGLRERYLGQKTGSAVWRAMVYRGTLREEGYEGFLQSHVAKRRGDEALTEVKMVDVYGSRMGMERAIQYVDRLRGHLKLPLNAREAERRWPIENYQELRDKQDALLEASTNRTYLDDYLAKDPWFARNGTTPAQVARDHRYTKLLEEVSGKGVPVLTLASADDYILSPANVSDLRKLETAGRPDQAARVFDQGGHTGLFLSPDVRKAMMDFLRRPPQPSPEEKPAPAPPASEWLHR